MLKFLIKMVLAIGIAMALFSAYAARAAEGECYADWSDAGPIVRKEGLTPAKQLPELARGQVEGDLIKITLCEEDGRYVYKLVFFDAGGKVTNLTVDAKEPFPQ